MRWRPRLRAPAAAVLGGALLLWAPPVAGAGEAASPEPLGSGDPRAVLEALLAGTTRPHVGRVTVVSFTAVGPRVADLDVRVGAMGEVELRRPTRWLVAGRDTSWVRTTTGATTVAPLAAGLGMDADAVLAGWDATVGPPRTLDTGSATPLHLTRRTGAAVEEVLYVDRETSVPVRRETRDAHGTVLRVVAYTELAEVEMAGSAPLAIGPSGDEPTLDPARVDALRDRGYELPVQLDAGFALLTVDEHDEVVAARYGDGLSVMSVYQQLGMLDPDELDGARIEHLAGRDVWTWPGREPTRLVWTGDDRTWTVVTDAPAAVIEDAVAALPGDLVAHDVPSRIRRGLARLWRWLDGGGG